MSNEEVLKAEKYAKLNLDRPAPWLAVLLIGTGLLLLTANLLHFHLINILWPGFIIIPGLMLMWPAHNSTPEHETLASFLAVPGGLVTAVGILLFVMNLTGHFEAWAYSWTLLPIAAMAGLMYAKRFDSDSPIHSAGRKMIRAMGSLFIVLGLMFEIVIFETFGPWLPLALIAFGVYLLFKRQF